MTDDFRRPRRNTRLAIGRDIDAWCGRCKREVGHIITAMVGNAVAQVRCESCNSLHKYRPPEAEKLRRSGTTAEGRARANAKAAGLTSDVATYQRMMAKRDPADAAEYSIFSRPAEGDLIRHSKFGLGIVRAVGADKAEVLFAKGKKTLIVSR